MIDSTLPRDLVGRLIARLEELLAANAPESRDPPPLRTGMTGPNAPALGAAILPLHSHYSPDQELLFA
ncbi:MAG: hypothetical protein JOZ58_01770 [Acetobacteraceae bacterium]|nr:hypothetical protein [Acetobacteraceae bacterium]